MKQTFEQSVKEIAKIFGIDENSLGLLSSFFLKIKITPDQQTFNTFRKQNKNVDKDFLKGGNTTRYLTIYQAAKEMREAKQMNDILLKYNINQENFVNAVLTFAKSFKNIQSSLTFENAFNLPIENFFTTANAKSILTAAPNLLLTTALLFFTPRETSREAETQIKTGMPTEFKKAFEQSESESKADRMMKEADEQIKREAEADRMMKEADEQIKRESENNKETKKENENKKNEPSILDKLKYSLLGGALAKGGIITTAIILVFAYNVLKKKSKN